MQFVTQDNFKQVFACTEEIC